VPGGAVDVQTQCRTLKGSKVASMCSAGSKVTLVAAIFGLLIGLGAIGLGGWFAATLYLQLPNYQWNRSCTNATAALAVYWDQYYNIGTSERPIFNLTVPSLGMLSLCVHQFYEKIVLNTIETFQPHFRTEPSAVLLFCCAIPFRNEQNQRAP
jgi:hypothetical protein